MRGGIVLLPGTMDASCLEEKVNSLFLSRLTWSRVLPSEDGNGRRPIGIGMLMINTQASTLLLLTNQTRAMFLESGTLSTSGIKGKDSPCSRVCSKPSIRPIDKTPVG
jgi:hypothetical protein